MKVADFDFALPAELIAQRPAPRRDGSRLMVLDRGAGTVDHRRFDELDSILRPDDLLVLNDTRVLPARLIGRKASGGRVELLLVEQVESGEPDEWRCLLNASRKPVEGAPLEFTHGLSATVLGRDGGEWRVRLACEGSAVAEAVERAGRAPLPPYIRRNDEEPDEQDRQRYQTVYACRPGAIAAPTAGLHFTDTLLGRLSAAGVSRAFVTLHVGLGTFRPVTVERVEQHRMHEEIFDLPQAAAAEVAEVRRRGGRVVAVGTTVVRTLEACASGDGQVEPRAGSLQFVAHRIRDLYRRRAGLPHGAQGVSRGVQCRQQREGLRALARPRGARLWP